MLTKFSEVKVSLNEREENKSKMKWNDTANTRRNTHTKQSEIIKKTKREQRNKNRRGTRHRRGHLERNN